MTTPIAFIAPPVLAFGPTASGKSAYAMARAAEMPSLIVNADSMQVYADLVVLTARPTPADVAAVPHALFGHIDGADTYSTGRYARDADAVLADAAARGLRPIIVGGTGLYFRAMLQGLSPVPEIPAQVRTYWREMQREVGSERAWHILAERDPVMAARLRPSDPQRVVRALEVLDATGKSLAAWQAEPGTPLLDPKACERVLIAPPMARVVDRAEQRFDRMMASGAVEEVASLLARRLDPGLPVMRALGVPELSTYLYGAAVLDDAIAAAKAATRAYIKRQRTWARREMTGWTVVDPDLGELRPF